MRQSKIVPTKIIHLGKWKKAYKEKSALHFKKYSATEKWAMNKLEEYI